MPMRHPAVRHVPHIYLIKPANKHRHSRTIGIGLHYLHLVVESRGGPVAIPVTTNAIKPQLSAQHVSPPSTTVLWAGLSKTAISGWLVLIPTACYGHQYETAKILTWERARSAGQAMNKCKRLHLHLLAGASSASA